MRIISLSVDGIHQAAHCGLFDWLPGQDAEIICLQDVRAQESELFQIPGFELDGYFTYVLDSPEPHQDGVVIYTRQQPKALVYGFGLTNGMDVNGRYLQADFEHISVGSLLAPAAEAGQPSQQIKDRFFTDLQNHLQKITHKRRRYIICGNWQMAHTHHDIENAANHEAESGFLEHERLWMNQLAQQIGYVDAFRVSNGDHDEFSHWPSGTQGKGGWLAHRLPDYYPLAGRQGGIRSAL